jgi:hypothetical protein
VRAIVLSLLVVAACGAPAKAPPPAKVTERKIDPPEDKPSSIVTVKEEPKADPYQASSGVGDSPVPYVRDERSSRLDMPFPKGHAKLAWRSSLALADTTFHASFVLSAGNRVVATGTEAWVLFDTKGVRIAGHEMEAPAIRVDRASGVIVPDDTRAADLPPDSKLAAHNGLVVLVKQGGVYVGERQIEGKFEGIDVAIDEKGLANVLVKQSDDLALWTIPTIGNTAIGRHKLGKRKPVGPPILGKTTRVFVLDNGIVAYTHDGKKLWERKGIPTGGVSMTSDERVLIADGNKIFTVDHKGKPVELWSEPDVTFVTPPIINADGVLFVASGSLLHAITFS